MSGGGIGGSLASDRALTNMADSGSHCHLVLRLICTKTGRKLPCEADQQMLCLMGNLRMVG